MAKANIDSVTTKLAKELADGAWEASKTKVVPSGMEQIGPKELAKRWPHLGDAQRQRIRQSMATGQDPQGVDTLLRILQGGK